MHYKSFIKNESDITQMTITNVNHCNNVIFLLSLGLVIHMS